MTIQKIQISPLKSMTKIQVHIGNHTVGSHVFYEYEENAIDILFSEVKNLAKELKETKSPDLKIGRLYTKAEIGKLSFTMATDYKRDIEEYKNIIANLPYLEDDQVTLSQMRAFTSISNYYGRHGSKTYLKYSDIHEAMNHLEAVKERLLNSLVAENEKMIYIKI